MTDDWVPAFEGQRPPFEPGNQVAVKHGARGELAIAPRAAELVEVVCACVPARAEHDDLTIVMLARILARIERVDAWLEGGGFANDQLASDLVKRLSTWENTAARLMHQLGMTPTSRARLGLDLSRTSGALAEYLAGRYGGDEKEAEV